MSMDGPGYSSFYGVCGFVTCDWSLKVEVQINGNISTYKLQHGIPLDLQENLSLIATGFSSSPSPIHGATFVKSMDTVVVVGCTLSSPAKVGSPVKGLIGKIQCPS